MSETPESGNSSEANHSGADGNSEDSPDSSPSTTPPPYRPSGTQANPPQNPPPPPSWQSAPTAANPWEAAPTATNPWEVAPSTPNPWQPPTDATVQMPLSSPGSPGGQPVTPGSTGGWQSGPPRSPGSTGGWQPLPGPAGPGGPPQTPPSGPPLGPPVGGFGPQQIPGQAVASNDNPKGRGALIVGIIIVLCLVVGGVVAGLVVSSSNSSDFTVAVDSCSIAADGTVVAKGTVTSQKSATADITISFTDADNSAGLGTRTQSVESSPQGTAWTETIEVGDTVQKVTCTASA